MKIEEYFKKSFKIFKNNVLTLVLSTLIVFALGVLTLGILLPTLYTGLQMMILKAKRGQQISISDLFNYINKTLSLIGAFIITVILTFLGLIIFVIPGLIIATLFMYTNLYIADKNMGILEAMSASKDLVMKNSLLLHLAFYIAISIVGNIGGSVYGLFLFLTFPIGYGTISCAYDDLTTTQNQTTQSI